ncbi:MAG: hypothetical protein Q7T08_01980 [Devosia sp.]|nr:hypothetical protein [Devosia sp.]
MRLIIHIGAAKCGSTSIQNDLALNAAPLRRNGVLIPDENLGLTGKVSGNHIWVFQNLTLPGADRSLVRRQLVALQKTMSSEKLHTLVISAENLINEAAFAEICAPALDLFDDIAVIAYVRRQDDYLLSAWRQWWSKQDRSFERYLGDVVGRDADWARLIAPWERAFGSRRLRLRRFDREHLVNNDVVDDFIRTAGLPQHDSKPIGGIANPTFSDGVVRLAHEVREVFSSIHDDRFYAIVWDVLGKDSLKAQPGSTLLTLAERQRIMSVYEAGNEELRKSYFPDLAPDEPLFPAPSEQDVASIDSAEESRLREALMLRLIAGLVKRVQGDKP